MKLYHGTNYSAAINICQNGIDLKYSQPYLDFGPGFYTTPSYDHAAITAIRKTDKYNTKYHRNEEPYIIQLEYFPSKELNIISFPRHGAEWGQFVLNNRLRPDILRKYNIDKHNQDSRYDICMGEIADAVIANVAYQVNCGNLDPRLINYVQFVKQNGKVYPPQYSFHSLKAFDCIYNITCNILYSKEKYEKIIQKVKR